jgi:hypothetical protein
VTIDQIVDVIAVRHCLVPGSVHVARFVSGAAMLRSAAIGIARRNLDHVLIDMVAVGVMQVPVVKVVDMVTVPNCRMAATGSVLMRVIGMVRTGTRGHEWPPCSAGRSPKIRAKRRHRYLAAPAFAALFQGRGARAEA